jgi:predicted nucleotidyltransferase
VTQAIDLSPSDMAMVCEVLRAHLPSGTQAWVFGSRANASAQRYSDLDLALEWDRPLSLDVLGDVKEALSDSDLPYKVDVLDLRTVDPAFRALIAPEMIALPY